MSAEYPMAATTSTRPQEAMVELFGNVPGIEISKMTRSEHDMEGTFNFLNQAFQQQSSLMNPFGIVTATRGTFPIKSTADEATIATLFVASSDRFKGDMSGAVLKPDQTVFAQWLRSSKPTMIQKGETELPVSVLGAPYGKMKTSSYGMGHTYADESGDGIKVVTRGCNQPKTWCMIGSCLCFFPTLSIGSIAMMCYMQTMPGLFDLKRTPDGPTVGTLKFWSQGGDLSTTSKMRVEFADGTDAKTRASAALASLFFMAEDFIEPPRGNSDDGPGDSGAPDVSVMDR